jgi:hypothetical protein
VDARDPGPVPQPVGGHPPQQIRTAVGEGASRWPTERRGAGVSYTVHRILAGIADEQERFEAIGTPPEGKSRWTPDEANRRAGRQVVKPVTPQEKVSAIHTLAKTRRSRRR